MLSHICPISYIIRYLCAVFLLIPSISMLHNLTITFYIIVSLGLRGRNCLCGFIYDYPKLYMLRRWDHPSILTVNEVKQKYFVT